MILCEHRGAQEIIIPCQDLESARICKGAWLDEHQYESRMADISCLRAHLQGYSFSVCIECRLEMMDRELARRAQ